MYAIRSYYVRQTGDMVYLTMRHEPAEIAESGEPMPADSGQDAAGEPEYFWARIDNDGRRAILWWPDVEQIRSYNFV